MVCVRLEATRPTVIRGDMGEGKMLAAPTALTHSPERNQIGLEVSHIESALLLARSHHLCGWMSGASRSDHSS